MKKCESSEAGTRRREDQVLPSHLRRRKSRRESSRHAPLSPLCRPVKFLLAKYERKMTANAHPDAALRLLPPFLSLLSSFLSSSFFFLTEKRHYSWDLLGNLRSAETVASPYSLSLLIRHGSRNFIAGNISYVPGAHPGKGKCFRANLDTLLVLLSAEIGRISARDRCSFESAFR